MKNKREREEACPICQHYHDYLGGERCSICGHTLVREEEACATPSALPTELLPGFLFVGSYDHASRGELLRALGIGFILNTVPTSTNIYKNSFRYHTVTTVPPSFEECCDFLDYVEVSNGKVLVHCMSGNSRAPSIALYYLMRKYGKKLDEAYAILKRKRPSLAFHSGEAVRLGEAEVNIFGSAASGFEVPVGKQVECAQR